MAQGIRTINGYTNNYPTVTTLSNPVVWNTTYMLGDISSLSFTVPTYNPANGSCEIRICFKASAVFNASINTSNFEVAYGFEEIQPFSTDGSYEISIVPLNSSTVRILYKELGVNDYGGWDNFSNIEIIPYTKANYGYSSNAYYFINNGNSSSCSSVAGPDPTMASGLYAYIITASNASPYMQKMYFYLVVNTLDGQVVNLNDWMAGNHILQALASVTVNAGVPNYSNYGNFKLTLFNKDYDKTVIPGNGSTFTSDGTYTKEYTLFPNSLFAFQTDKCILALDSESTYYGATPNIQIWQRNTNLTITLDGVSKNVVANLSTWEIQGTLANPWTLTASGTAAPGYAGPSITGTFFIPNADINCTITGNRTITAPKYNGTNNQTTWTVNGTTFKTLDAWDYAVGTTSQTFTLTGKLKDFGFVDGDNTVFIQLGVITGSGGNRTASVTLNIAF